MRAKEVVVSNPESQVVVGTFDVVKAVCVTVGSLISTVQPFDHLFEWSMFCGDSIVVGKSNDLSDLEGKVLAELSHEFHCSKRAGTVTVSDELKVLRKLRKPLKSHAHGKDTGTNATVVGHLITDDGAGGGIHDEPDVGFDAADIDISFVSCENISFFVRVLVDKGFDADGCGFAVVGDLLVGDTDVVQIFQSLRGFTERQTEIDMQGKAQGHDMGVVLAEF